jgi:hypothetical protein
MRRCLLWILPLALVLVGDTAVPRAMTALLGEIGAK